MFINNRHVNEATHLIGHLISQKILLISLICQYGILLRGLFSSLKLQVPIKINSPFFILYRIFQRNHIVAVADMPDVEPPSAIISIQSNVQQTSDSQQTLYNENSNTLWDNNDPEEHCNEETNIYQPIRETDYNLQQEPGSPFSTSRLGVAALPNTEFIAGCSGINNQRKQRIKSENDLDV